MDRYKRMYSVEMSEATSFASRGVRGDEEDDDHVDYVETDGNLTKAPAATEERSSAGEVVASLLLWCYSERDTKCAAVSNFLSSVFDHYHLTNYKINQLLESHPLCNYKSHYDIKSDIKYNNNNNNNISNKYEDNDNDNTEIYDNAYLKKLSTMESSSKMLKEIKLYSFNLEKEIKEYLNGEEDDFETYIVDKGQQYQVQLSKFVNNIYLDWKQDDRNRIIETVESIILIRLFDLICPINKEKDNEIKYAISFLKTQPMDFLEIHPVHLKSIKWALAVVELSHINLYQTPRDKIMCLLRFSRIISQGLKESGKSFGADEFINCLVLVVIKTNPAYLYSNIKYIEIFRSQDLLLSEAAYYFVTLSSAMTFITNKYHELLSQSQIINMSVAGEETTSTMTRNNSTISFKLDNYPSLTKSLESIELLMSEPPESSDDIPLANNDSGDTQSIDSPPPTIYNNVQDDQIHTEIEEKKLEILSSIIHLAISNGYDSRIRSGLMRFAAKLNPLEAELALIVMEVAVGQNLIDSTSKNKSSGIKNLFERTTSNYRSLKIGVAALTGGALLAVGGLVAAPVIGAALHLVGATAFFSALSAAGISGTALTSILFGAAGATITAEHVKKHTSGIEELAIKKVNETFGLHVVIGALGWVENPEESGKQDVVQWEQSLVSGVQCLGEIYTVSWESRLLNELYESLKNYKKQVEDNSTFAKFTARMLHDAILPSASILEAASLIKTCWGTVKESAHKAGQVLADEILSVNRFGKRPITLVGVSMGASLIYYCLLELIAKKAHGMIENVVFIGAPVPINLATWVKIRKIASGRVVNCYSPDDILLQYCYESNSMPEERNYLAAGFAPVRVSKHPDQQSFSSLFGDGLFSKQVVKNTSSEPIEMKETTTSSSQIESSRTPPTSPIKNQSRNEQDEQSSIKNSVEMLMSSRISAKQLQQTMKQEKLNKKIHYYVNMIENVDVRATISSHLDYQKEGVLKKIFSHVNINHSAECNPFLVVNKE